MNLGDHRRIVDCPPPGTLEGRGGSFLLTVDPHPEAVLPALALLAHYVRSGADRGVPSARGRLRGHRPRRRAHRPRRRARPLPAAGHHGHAVPSWPWSTRAAWSRSIPSGGSTTSCCRAPGPPRSTPGSACWPRRLGGAPPARRRQVSLGELVIDEAHLHGAPARPAARPHLQGVRAAEVPGPARRAGCSPAPSCCRRCGATTSSAAPAPSTCTCGGLRAKLGTEYEPLIGTVRNVGYKRSGPRAVDRPLPARSWPTTTRRTTTRTRRTACPSPSTCSARE